MSFWSSITMPPWRARTDEREQAIRQYPGMQRGWGAWARVWTRASLVAPGKLKADAEALNHWLELGSAIGRWKKLDIEISNAIMEAGKDAHKNGELRFEDIPTTSDVEPQLGEIVTILVIVAAAVVAVAGYLGLDSWVKLQEARELTEQTRIHHDSLAAWIAAQERNPKVRSLPPATAGGGSGGRGGGSLINVEGGLGWGAAAALAGVAWFMLRRPRRKGA